MPRPALTTFLVDTYVVGLDATMAEVLDSRVKAGVAALQADHGRVEWCGSVTIAAEDTYSTILAAEDVTHVRALCRSAGMTCDHVVEIRVAGLR